MTEGTLMSALYIYADFQNKSLTSTNIAVTPLTTLNIEKIKTKTFNSILSLHISFSEEAPPQSCQKVILPDNKIHKIEKFSLMDIFQKGQ